MRRKLWLAYLASMLVLLSAYLQVDSLRTKDVLLAVFGASSAFASFAGIAIFKPARRRIWILVGTAQALETIGTLFYY